MSKPRPTPAAALTFTPLAALAVGIAWGFAAASLVYSLRYRSLRRKIAVGGDGIPSADTVAWAERMADEVEASPSRYLSDVDERALRGDLRLPLSVIDHAPVTVREMMRRMRRKS
ncbi:hypothetical protein M527_29305 [Sphingobium indicum IP26]|uniref:hypothetical protein n=1 Tax=Sphingobium sp. HDIP04 TaxID=428994 RepID=UPI00037FB547|nr:hypothetical protein [Sphingobium sp. HDIP04]EPR14208.1 hypothetical protein M527_29305 [Sphingobium indicum IP26]EQB03691.1 hypothetical protein L286_11770 [Sphingobium sp. HDIP04]